MVDLQVCEGCRGPQCVLGASSITHLADLTTQRHGSSVDWPARPSTGRLRVYLIPRRRDWRVEGS